MDTAASPAANGQIHTVTVPADKQVRFSLVDLLAQAKADLWAKEVQTGYTTTYAWMANQLGHFALGFIPVYVLIWVALGLGLDNWIKIWFGEGTLRWAQFIIPGVWLAWFVAKELGDIKEAIKDAKQANYFPMDADDVRNDALTAVYFFGAGIAVAASALLASSLEGHAWYGLPVAVSIAQFLVGLFPAYYWLSRKKCFQQADLPYIFRLANFPPKIETPGPQQAVPGILDFTSLKGPWRHILICGPLQSGKTSLASAIGTEHTFQRGKARYLAVLDFLRFADLSYDPSSSPSRPLWPWKESNLLILDDLDPGGDVIKREEIVSHLLGLKSLAELRTLRTVWLVSGDAPYWHEKLAEVLGAKDEEIGVIHLTEAKLRHTGAEADFLTLTTLSSSALSALADAGKSYAARQKSVGLAITTADGKVLTYSGDQLPPHILQPLTAIIEKESTSPSVLALSQNAARPEKEMTGQALVPKEIGGLALGIDSDSVFVDARARIELVFKLNLAIAIVLAVILLTGIGASVYSAVSLRQAIWSSVFGGVSVADMIGIYAFKPLTAINSALVSTQRLDYLQLRLKQQLAACGQHMNLKTRIECQGSVWLQLQEELASVGEPSARASLRRVGA